jgi:sterol 24-C-methyltransferase
MAPSKLEQEDHSRDAAFNKAMHKDSSKAEGGFRAMMKKDKAAQQAAVNEYFKHWDNKAAKDETDADREVCYPNPDQHAIASPDSGFTVTKS